jgi:hypothetical protein
VRARTTAAGLACLHRAHPHLTGCLYGYDPSATLNDAATLNNTTRNDATDNDSTHDDLATPTTTTRPTLNVNAD